MLTVDGSDVPMSKRSVAKNACDHYCNSDRGPVVQNVLEIHRAAG
jgi:hypothetical protein